MRLHCVACAPRVHPDPTTQAGVHANWNAGFIRQAGEPHQGLPDESGVPAEVSGSARAPRVRLRFTHPLRPAAFAKAA